MNSKLLKSGIILTLGNLLIQGLSFITLPIYTRIISTEVFGQFNLFVSWTSIISLFIGMQLSGSLSIGKLKYENFKEYTTNILTLSNIIFLIIFTLGYLFKSSLSIFFNFSEKYVLIIFIQSYFSYLVGFLTTYFIQLHESIKVFIISFFSSIINIILSISLINLLEDDFKARVIGNLIPVLIFGFISMIYFYKDQKLSLNKEYSLFALSISIPLIFHHLGHNILNQFDRIMIGKMMDLHSLAIYSFGYNLGFIMQIVLNSINSAWIPWFFKAKKENNKELNYFVKIYLFIGLFLTLGYLTIFPDLAILMGGEKYSQSISFISLIILSYFFVFLYTFPVNIQFYHENTKFIPFGTLFAGVLNILLNYILIPTLGVYGASVATILSYISLLVVHHLISKKLYNYKDVSVKMFLILSLIAVFYSILMNYFVASLIIRWSLGILVFIIYLIYFKNDIFNYFMLYKEKRRQ